MIFLDSERFIAEAIESVLAQTFKDWELILVDDGSTDDSTAIAKCYEELWPGRIRYIDHPSHKNLGMSASRNCGIRASVGQYIAMLDSDDVWLPERLERHVGILLSVPQAEMVYGVGLMWHTWSDPAARDIPWHFERGLTLNRVIQPPDLIPLLLRSGFPDSSSWLARRSAGNRVGWYEERFRGVSEDAAFFTKFFFEHPVYSDNRVITKYRVHPDSVCSRLSKEEWRLERFRFLGWFKMRCDCRNIRDRNILAALRSELFRANHPTLRRFHPSDLLRAAKAVLISSLKFPNRLMPRR